MRHFILQKFILLLLTFWLSACATTPNYRTSIPMNSDQNVEAGLGIHLGGGYEVNRASTRDVSFDGPTVSFKGPTVSLGSTAFITVRVPKTQFYVFGAGRGTGILGFIDAPGAGGIGGGQLGMRMDYELIEDLWIAGEAFADYQYVGFSKDPYHQFSGVVSLIIAEKLINNIWIYARPTAGVGVPVPLIEGTITQVFSVPLGIDLKLNENFSFRIEGGYDLFRNGIVLGSAAAVRF